MNVSVIIPARNAEKTLARAVASALNSEAGEVLIGYDASEDDTWNVALDVAYEWPDVIMTHSLSNVRIGVCALRNMLITKAKYSLIVPLDADDYFLPGGLQALVSAWQPGTWVYGAYEDDRGQIITPPPPGMLPQKNVTQATMCFSKDVWLHVGGYDPTFNLGAEDYAFQRRLTRAGIHGTRIPQPVYHYTDNPNGRAAVCQRRWPLIKQLLDDECPV